MNRISWKKKFHDLEIEFKKLEGYKKTTESVLKEQRQFQVKIVKVERLHYIIAGLIALLTAIQVFLFVHQNKLVSQQNLLFQNQNNLVDEQNELFSTQNEQIDLQLKITEEQNKKIDQQTEIYKTQIKLLEKQTNQDQYLTTWPRLAVDFRERGFVELKLRNSGIGPAEIKWAQLKYDGNNITFPKLIFAIYNKQPDFWKEVNTNFQTVTITGNILSPNKEYTFFKISEKYSPNFNYYLNHLELTICYCSIAKDCWIYTRRFDDSLPGQKTERITMPADIDDDFKI